MLEPSTAFTNVRIPSTKKVTQSSVEQMGKNMEKHSFGERNIQVDATEATSQITRGHADFVMQDQSTYMCLHSSSDHSDVFKRQLFFIVAWVEFG